MKAWEAARFPAQEALVVSPGMERIALARRQSQAAAKDQQSKGRQIDYARSCYVAQCSAKRPVPARVGAFPGSYACDRSLRRCDPLLSTPLDLIPMSLA